MKHTTDWNWLLFGDTPNKFKKTAATVESTTKQTVTAVMDFFFVKSSECIKITKWLYSYTNKLAHTLLSCDIRTSSVNVIHKKYGHLKLPHPYFNVCWTVSRFIMDVLNIS